MCADMSLFATLITRPLSSFPQDYLYPDVKDRQFLRYFYKAAGKNKFNVEKYNELKDEMAEVCPFSHNLTHLHMLDKYKM